MKLRLACLLLITLLAIPSLRAHEGAHPSTHDALAGVIERLKKTHSHDELVNLTLEQAEAALTDEERRIIATEHLRFKTNVPVRVHLAHDARLTNDPFWLRDWTATDHRIKVNNRYEFAIRTKEFPAGMVGLGVSSLSGQGEHYFVLVEPAERGAKLEITDVYPAAHTLGTFEPGANPAADVTAIVTDAPEALRGMTMIRSITERDREGQLVNVFRVTPYPSSPAPDHVVLTWSGDPRRTQTIQWRTSPATKKGRVAYMKKSDYNRFNPKKPKRVDAVTEIIETPTLVNDSVMLRHTARLTDLEPATTYLYSVGDGSSDGWTEFAEFTTAPDGVEPFSFIYMGDAQNGLERWGSLIHRSFLHRPDAAFYVMAGDLVNRGSERDDWDSYFENAKHIFNRRQVVPVPGNHEYQGGDCQMYLDMFALPETSPIGEKAYTFEYSNALFVCLDSNLPVETQTEWLEEQLAGSNAKWKFVVYHHPAYSSGPRRDNPEIREVWGAIFDKYHVDLALQGHDHAYLRTYPMKAGQRVGSPAEGTIYIVSVSGTKFYEQAEHEYTEFGMTKVATYQAIDIKISGDQLVYRSYDDKGDLRDEFVIEK